MARVDDSKLELIKWTVAVSLNKVAKSRQVCGDAHGRRSWSSRDGRDPRNPRWGIAGVQFTMPLCRRGVPK